MSFIIYYQFYWALEVSKIFKIALGVSAALVSIPILAGPSSQPILLQSIPTNQLASAKLIPTVAHVTITNSATGSVLGLQFNSAGNLNNAGTIQHAAPVALSTGVSILNQSSITGAAAGANATVSGLVANNGAGLSSIEQSSGTNNSQTGLAVNTAATSSIHNAAQSSSSSQLLINSGTGAASNATGAVYSQSIVTASQLNAGYVAPQVAVVAAIPLTDH